MMNMITRTINKLLHTHSKNAEAEAIKQSIIDVSLETSQKIDKMNSTFKKTRTYYIGKGMGIVKS